MYDKNFALLNQRFFANKFQYWRNTRDVSKQSFLCYDLHMFTLGAFWRKNAVGKIRKRSRNPVRTATKTAMEGRLESKHSLKVYSPVIFIEL